MRGQQPFAPVLWGKRRCVDMVGMEREESRGESQLSSNIQKGKARIDFSECLLCVTHCAFHYKTAFTALEIHQ